MSKNEWEKVDEKINRKLREFEVDVPDFPMKKSSLDRLANWMFQPVSMPFSSLNTSWKKVDAGPSDAPIYYHYYCIRHSIIFLKRSYYLC